MHELGIESSLVQDIVSGDKTIEGRLGTPKFLKLRVGDMLQIREDVWKDGKIIESIPDRAAIEITQLLYFESFEEMFDAVDYTAAVPSAQTAKEAIATYRKFYSPEDEHENGVVAITFRLV